LGVLPPAKREHKRCYELDRTANHAVCSRVSRLHIVEMCLASRKSRTLESNLVGGDILGGAMNIGQLLFRPTSSLYRTPIPGLYFCGASTPPGGGVHGVCGYHAANAALRDVHYR
jgi:phytoene dehydrogenase-like protein